MRSFKLTNYGELNANLFFSVLGLIFIVLKLAGTIAWSWWWVLAPFWGPVVVFLVLLFVGASLSLIFNRPYKHFKSWRNFWIF